MSILVDVLLYLIGDATEARRERGGFRFGFRHRRVGCESRGGEMCAMCRRTQISPKYNLVKYVHHSMRPQMHKFMNLSKFC